MNSISSQIRATAIRIFYIIISAITSVSLNASALSISSPPDSSTFFERDTIAFICSAAAGKIADSGIIWKSDRDGELGRGRSLSTAALSVGSHRISLAQNAGRIENSLYLTILQFDAVDIYCSGGTSGKAYYWINGIRFSVSPDPETYIKKICAFQDGFCYIPNPRSLRDTMPGYWHNDRFIQVPGIDQTRIEDITINGSDVFLVGWERKSYNSPSRACYWKNGIKAILEEAFSGATAVFSNSSLYIAGMIDGRPCFWKDEAITCIAPSDTPYVSLNHIFASGNDVYIAGNESMAVGDVVYRAGWYWHNGRKRYFRELANESNPHAAWELWAFHVDAEDRYAIAGGRIWKNDYILNIEDPRAPDRGRYAAVDVLHGHLFVAGYYQKNGALRRCYWRNGERYEFADTSNILTTGFIYSMDVVVRNDSFNPKPVGIDPGRRYISASGKRPMPAPTPLRMSGRDAMGVRSRRGVRFDILGRLRRLLQ